MLPFILFLASFFASLIARRKNFYIGLLILVFPFSYLVHDIITISDTGKGIGYSFGIMIFWAITAVFSLIILIKIIILEFYQRSLRDTSEQFLPNNNLTILGACLCLYLAFLFYQPLWLVLFLILAAFEQKLFKTKKQFIFTAAIALPAFIVINLGAAFYVLKKASDIAGTNPYCIQVASKHGLYKPAETLLDLMPINMRSNSRAKFHSALLVGHGPLQKYMNWSYKRGSFLEYNSRNSISGSVGRYCKPKADFSRKMPLFISKQSQTVFYQYNKDVYHIPAKYDPSFYESSVSIIASAPDFLPLPRKILPRTERYKKVISWGHSHGNLSYYSEIKPETKHALYGLDAYDTKSGFKTYVAHDAKNEIITVINCYTEHCQHIFHKNGFRFDMRYKQEHVANWKQTEEKLISLIDLFTSNAP